MSIVPHFDAREVAKRLQRLRQNHYLAYGMTITAVAIATLVRLAIDKYLPGGLPFITYFAAIAAATWLGGLGPGSAAVLLSAFVAWFVFLQPPLQLVLTGSEALALFVFFLFSVLLVVIVTALNQRALLR